MALHGSIRACKVFHCKADPDPDPAYQHNADQYNPGFIAASQKLRDICIYVLASQLISILIIITIMETCFLMEL
jgi:hypothetical protein